MRGWNQDLKIIFYVFVAVFIGVLIWTVYQGSYSRRRVKADWLRRDLETVKTLIEEHVDPYWKHPKEDFERLIEKAESSIKKMHRMDFYLLIQPIFALLSDHESYVHFGMPSYMPVLPFRVKIEKGKMFVHSSIDPRIEDGSLVEEFDGMKTEDFMKWLENYIGAENEAHWEELAEELIFRLPSIQRREKYEIVADGKKLTVKSLAIARYEEKLKELGKKEEPFELLEKNGCKVLKIRTFSIWGRDIRDFEDVLRNLDGDELVIDLRGNGGGSWKMAKMLVSYIVDRRVSFKRRVVTKSETRDEEVSVEPIGEGFKGKVYVLVDRRTLDEAYDAALLLSKIATVVGEEPEIGEFRFAYPSFKRLPSVGMYATVSKAKIEHLEKLRVFPEKVCENGGEL